MDPGSLGVALRKLNEARRRIAQDLAKPVTLDGLIRDAIWSIREEIRGRK